jgi:hypothetical protein
MRSLTLFCLLQPVHGNVIVEVEPSEPDNTYNWRVSNIWSEFNSAAWLVNLGVFRPGQMALETQDVEHLKQFNDTVSSRKVHYRQQVFVQEVVQVTGRLQGSARW